jgi:hypothetical protein
MGEVESVHGGVLAPSPALPPKKKVIPREDPAIQKAAQEWLESQRSSEASHKMPKGVSQKPVETMSKAKRVAQQVLPTPSATLPSHAQLRKVLEHSQSTKQFDDLITKLLRTGSSDHLPSHEQAETIKKGFFSLPVDAWKGVLQYVYAVCKDPRMHARNVEGLVRALERQVPRAHAMAQTLEREYPKLLLRTVMTDEQVQHFSDSLAHIPGNDLKVLYGHIARLQKGASRHKFLEERIGLWRTKGTDQRVKENVEKLMQTFQPHLSYLQFLKEQTAQRVMTLLPKGRSF